MIANKLYGKKILITGHTGFKGSWLCEILLSLGADIIGVSLPLSSENILFNSLNLSNRIKHIEQDIRDFEGLLRIIDEVQPEIIFHLAAQPLVKHSYEFPIDTFETNFNGTLNLLEAIRIKSIENIKWKCSVIIVTTDKVYENREWDYSYRENDSLGGNDPYSASKAACEIVLASYQKSYFHRDKGSMVRVSSARAGNVIGGGDFARFRIVPDIIRSLSSGDKLLVRNSNATRPWQHVLEPLYGYILLALKQMEGLNTDKTHNHAFIPGAFNFGPNSSSIRTVSDLIVEAQKHISFFLQEEDILEQHEAQKLSLSYDKAYQFINWKPIWDFSETIDKTFSWYSDILDGSCSIETTQSQILEYMKRANDENYYSGRIE
jgi:CDP-glucose 4,6-dehydratase